MTVVLDVNQLSLRQLKYTLNMTMAQQSLKEI